MLDVRKPRLRPYALEGNFGLEREALRVTAEGRMALTPHPFPPDHPRIVRDFCENQTEINTGVHPTAEAAVAELKEIDATIRAAIEPQGERLWTNSNPPPITDESEIVPARFGGARAGKSTYRNYLAAKYGKRLMAYCGIHFNFSFGEKLIAAAGVNRDELYLHVASQCVKWGWAIVALTAASPAGQYASVRCSERGYWNSFTPVLDFSSARTYAKSIAQYVQKGLLVAHYNFRDTLHVWRDEDAVAFSTHPLSVGTWEPAPFTSLVAAKDGEVVRVSPPHGNEYIYNPNDYRMVYMEFARL